MELMVLLMLMVISEATRFPDLNVIDQETFRASEPQARLIKRYPIPPQQDERIKEWSTSRKEGWQGSKANPIRSGSPQRPPPPQKPPVLIHAAAKGPARLEVTNSQRPPKKTVYKVPPGKSFQKEFQDPKKLRIDGSAKQELRQDGKLGQRGRIRLSCMGGKSYTSIDGKPGCRNELESIGPGITSKRGRFETTELMGKHKELAYSKPPRETVFDQQLFQEGFIKNSSKHGQVATIGTLYGNEEDQIISAQVSNSPSHSPPISPGRPVRGLEDRWPPYMEQVGFRTRNP